MIKIRLCLIAFLVSVGLADADDISVANSDPGACMEGSIAQFGRYIGDWKIDDESFAKDGSGWSPGQGARWTFVCIGDGTGVQDYWMPNGGGFGTNLRIYNPETESWEIVWATPAQKGLMHISAKQSDSGAIVMDILSPVQDPPRRITFFPPDDTGWNWVMEMSFDGGETWTAVYRIRATPWEA